MKFKGKSIEPPQPVPVPLGRTDVQLLAGPIMDFDDFDRLCPEPEPPIEFDIKTRKRNRLVDDEKYIKRHEAWVEQKTNYMVIKSLTATPELEWETVDLEDPETWPEFRQELKASFSSREVDIIIGAVFQASLPSEKTQGEALNLFTSTQEDTQDESQSQTEEQDSTPSGEPANV